MESMRPFGESNPRVPMPVLAVELRIVRVHAHETILAGPDRIDPDVWNPLIMSFRKFYGLTAQVHDSRLAEGDERAWMPRRPDQPASSRSIAARARP